MESEHLITHFSNPGKTALRDPVQCTEQGVLSVARFCYVFLCELRGPAWAVGSYSISQSARGTSQNIIFKTLRQLGRPALYKSS